MEFLKKLLTRGRPKLTVLVVPYDEFGERDLARAFLLLFEDLSLPDTVALYPMVVLSPHILKTLGGDTPSALPGRILLFAHGHQDNLGFYANPGPSTGDVLLLRWWQHEEHKYELVIAHVCRGANILSKHPWRSTFPEWVSYRTPVWAFVGSARAAGRWAMILRDMCEAAQRARDATSLKHALLAIYHRNISTIYDTYSQSEGDALNLMYLEQCCQGLVSSGDTP